MKSQTTVAAPTGMRLVWQFGDVMLDETSRELVCAGKVVEVEPKPVELLMFLLRRVDEVVTRDEILDALWPGRVLSDGAVTNCIAKLREAIDDRDHSIVRTVPRCGYRLVADVQHTQVELRPPIADSTGLEPGSGVPLRPAWQLVRCLATGGATETWLAQRKGSDEKRVLRFAGDARGLALLKHEVMLFRALNEMLRDSSDYATLLDWNFDQPPFFLEYPYYPGGNLAEWCNSQGGLGCVPLRTRVELAARCASAVASAHSAGVFHRKLHPSNILVDGESGGAPRIRLCDFTAGDVIDPRRFPEREAGPPPEPQQARDAMAASVIYQAPELLAGYPATAQCDIYALGVLLYQLVVGDLRRPLAPGWEQEIEDSLLREDIAIAVAGDPQRRLADAGRLALRLRSLAPRRAERELQQRNAAAAEHLRHLKLRSRGRRDMLATLLIVVLFAGTGSAALYMRAQAAEQLARAQSEAVATVANLIAVTRDPFADPLQPDDLEPGFGELLDQTAQSLDWRLPDHPLVRARLRKVLGVAYGLRGDIDQAELLLGKAERAFEDELGPASPETQAARQSLRDIYRAAGQLDRMGAVAARMVAAEEAADRPHPEIWYDGAWGASLSSCVKKHGAVWLGDCSADIFALADQAARELGRTSATYLNLLWLGGTIAVASDIGVARAEPRLREGYQLALAGTHRNDHISSGFRVFWAASLCASGEALGALDLLERDSRPVSESAHRTGFHATAQLVRARCLLELGQPRAASESARAAYERSAQGPRDPLAALDALEIYARALIADGRAPEAITVIDRGAPAAREPGSAAEFEGLRRRILRVDAMAAAGVPAAEVEAALRRNLAAARQLYRRGQWPLGYCAARLGEWLVTQGRPDEGLLAEAYGLMRAALGDEDPRVLRIEGALAAKEQGG